MSQVPSLPPISPPLYGVMLIFLSALTSLLIGITLTLTVASQNLSENWQKRLTQTALIALPPNEAKNDTPIADLKEHLSSLPKIHNLHILHSEDVQTLLSTWSAPWPQPLPLAMTFSYEGDNQQLENFIHKWSPDAVFIPSPPQKKLLPPLQTALKKATSLLSNTLLLIAILSFILSINYNILFTLLKEQNTLIMLHNIGATKAILYNRITRMVAFQTFTGAILGIIIALPLANILALFLRPFAHLSIETGSFWLGMFKTSLSFKSLLILWSIPFLLTIFAILLTKIIINIRHRSSL